MKAFQRIFDTAVVTGLMMAASSAIGQGPAKGATALPPANEVRQYWRDARKVTAEPRPKKKDVRKWWIITVVILLAVSAGVIFGVGFFAGKYKPGVLALVTLWAVFFGIWAMYFLKQKVIAGTFGTVLGISANELASGGAGLLAKANSSIKDIAAQIGIIVGGSQDSIFIGQCIWIFLIIFGLFCLPAFFLDTQPDA